MRFLLGLITLTVLGGLIWGSYNLGAFKDVKMEKATAGPFLLYGVRHEGAYHEISKKIFQIEIWAQKTGIPCKQTFGLYVEDPYLVENERLISYGGCVAKGEDFELIKSKQNLMPGLKLIQINQNQFITGFFEGSPWIGPYKVYSRAQRWADEENSTSIFPALEIYQTDKIHIQTTYFFQVSFETPTKF
jgi:hypothetical protein